MKTRIASFFATLSLLLFMSACHDDISSGKTINEGEGTVSLASLSVEVSNLEEVISRSDIDVSDFTVQILSAEGQKVQEWKYSSVPELFNLTEGDYQVVIFNHPVQKAEWESPYFLGRQDFKITAGETTDVGVVTCKLSNIKVSIRYSDGLKEFMGEDCHAVVSVNDEGKLDYSQTETRAGYFEAIDGSTTLVAEFSGTVGGNNVTFRHLANDVHAGQHRIITFKLKNPKPEVDDNGNIIFDDTDIDVDIDNEDIGGNVNGGDDNLGDGDRPGQEGGENPPAGDSKVTITSDDVDFDNPNPTKDQVVVKIDAEDGIGHLVVSIISTSEVFTDALVEVGMPATFDLAYPGENEELLQAFGFPTGSAVIGAKHIDFNISEFVPLLDAFDGSHSFKLSVTDVNGIQLTKTLTFIVEQK